jgi:2-polyprenyl-3-methyl-5-hydroxy-6-metoxy-1,4-benzoquinol methylase
MFATLMLVALLSGSPAWKDFSDWFSREGTPGAPAEVLKRYAGQLKAQGVPEPEIAGRIKEVQQYLAANPREALALHFDRLYSWSDAKFSRDPSALVVKVASSRKPGKALDIAMGQGRNAVWLAKAGWTVSGYDISNEALRQANSAAEAAGVKLETRLASHEEYELGTGQWDLIVMSYAFTRLSDAAYMQRVRDSLKPGGILLIEGFNGGPRLEPNMILKAFLDYRILLFEDLPGMAEWGGEKAPLLRMALEKR